MVTDHLLVRRAALELGAALVGRRLRDAGFADGHDVTLLFGGRQDTAALHLQPFAAPPLVWLGADAPLSLQGEPGWLRAAAGVLRGLRLSAVRARAGDRILGFEFGGTSRFGVAAEARLIAELIPRFGNLLVLRGETIVAAQKTFSPSENETRSVQIGRGYEPPPLPQPALDRAGFEAALAEGAPRWMGALRDYLPQVPRVVATSLVLEAQALGLLPGRLADWFEARARTLDVLAAQPDVPLHVYRRAGEIVQAHVLPLLQYSDLEHATAPTILEVFGSLATTGERARSASDAERRRAALLRSLRARAQALRAQLTRLDERERELKGRDDLRRAGDAIYARLFELAPHAQAEAKAEAARYFERYRKATAALPHVAKRRAALERAQNEIDALLWEVERADAQTLREIAADLGGKPQRTGKPRTKVTPLELPSGARVYVGRSPRENAALTFELARPDDLWFHARNTPGAHVILTRPAREEPSEEDIATAAALAAYHSRARASGSVDVDYTRRKYVRKQRDASPGMVWYTDFKTIRVEPRGP